MSSRAALEILSSPKRLKAAMELAVNSHANSSAAKAFASALDYLEVADGQPLDQAHAHLLCAIALRRMGRATEARAAIDSCKNHLEQTGLRQRRAIQIRIDLCLEQAISSFLKADFIESARHNERAARLAESAALKEHAARGFLNAAVSWDRQGERAESKRCLDLCQQNLNYISLCSLHGSYHLFSWRMRIDHGPLVMPPDFHSLLTRSQQTLYFLYLWEQTLITSSPEAAALIQQQLLQKINDHKENQFDSELETLTSSARFLLEGKCGQKTPSLLQTNPTMSGVSILHIAGWLSLLMSEGRWKSLQHLAQKSTQASHPCLKAWGHRALFWLACKNQQTEEAIVAFESARKFAQISGMNRLCETLNIEFQAFKSKKFKVLDHASPQEKRIWTRFLSLLPNAWSLFLKITQTEKSEVEISQALLDLKKAKATVASSDHLIVDAIRDQIHLAGKTISLEKMPVQKKILFLLLATYPQPLSKEELVNGVWEEIYNPLVHDATLYRTLNRLRRGLTGTKKPWVALEDGHLKLLPEDRDFLAVLPKQEFERKALRLHERQVKILSLLKYRGKLTRAEAVKALEVPARTAARDLGFLVEKKMIVRSGQGRTTCYYPAL